MVSFFDAIELYRKANHHVEAAKLLTRLAKEHAANKVGGVGWLLAVGRCARADSSHTTTAMLQTQPVGSLCVAVQPC